MDFASRPARRAAVTLAALLLLPLLTAGNCDKKSNSNPPKNPNPAAQPEAPAADPGPHNDDEHAVLKVAWLGERSGDIEVSINHVVQPKFRAPRPTKMGGFYSGAWEHTYNLSGVTVIGFTWLPSGGNMSAQCSVIHKGSVVNYQGVDTGPCAASWTRS